MDGPFRESHDDRDLRRMGRQPRLKRIFRCATILPLTVLTQGTWLSVLSSSAFPLIDGGRAGMIWGFLCSWILMSFVVISLAEMVSMAPSSGGQYHWVSIFAHSRVQKPLSYLCGWLDVLAWSGFVAFTAYSTGTMILDLASVTSPSYVPSAWQGTLATIGVTIAAAVINTLALKQLPAFEVLAVILFSVTFFAIVICLSILSPTSPASEVFGELSDFGNWHSTGLAILVGQLGSGGSLLGSDSGAHMAEEVHNAAVAVPWTMILCVSISGITGLAMNIAFAFIVQDVDSQIAASKATYPFIGVFLSVVGRDITVGLISSVVALNFCSCVGSLATASRQVWSFADQGGFIFPSLFGSVTPIGDTRLPVYAIFASSALAIVFALLNLGGSEVFNSIAGLSTGSMLMTYSISIGSLLVLRVSGASLPEARWSLGRCGMVVNLVALAYVLQLNIFSFFPLFDHPSAVTMNWAVVVFGCVISLASINYYVCGSKSYKSPLEIETRPSQRSRETMNKNSDSSMDMDRSLGAS